MPDHVAPLSQRQDRVLSRRSSGLTAFLAPCRPHLAAAAGFSALLNLLYLAPTLYMLQVYERVVPTAGLATLLVLTLALLLALATLAYLDRARARLLVRAALRLDLAHADRLLDAGLACPNAARGMMRDFDTVRNALAGPAPLALCDVAWMPLYLGVCLLISPWIALLALLGCVALPLIAWVNERAAAPRLARARHAAAAASAAHAEAAAGAEVARALGMRRALVARVGGHRATMLGGLTDAGLGAADGLAWARFARLALQSLALGLGAVLAIEHAIAPAAIFAASFLVARALAPVEQLTGAWKALDGARVAWRGVSLVYDPAAPVPAPPTVLPAPVGRIELENVTVRLPGRAAPAIDRLSLSIEPGEVVAVVGPSGAGKSTLARVLAGALRPDDGRYRIDGAEAAQWDAEALGRHLGYVPQAATLFDGTVARNIARFSGGESADAQLDAQVVAAAKLAGAHAMILGLPQGYDTLLERGGGVSAGQAQRLALARAVFGDPALVVLDEPNAHLDTDGDQRLLALLEALKVAGRTVVIVTHRMSVLPAVDRILALQDGRVAAFGPRDAILARLSTPTAAVPAQTRKAAQA